MSRMSRPLRTKTPTVDTMSSCNALPVIMEISPTTTAGCIEKRSCNASEVAAAEALALGRTLHRQTQKFEPPSPQDQSFETEQNPAGKGTKRKSQNKMNKSFLLSGGRKNDRFGSGSKPATVPD